MNEANPPGLVLALDLGTKCGWAVGGKGVIISGVIDLKPTRFESAGMRFIRLLGFLKTLLEQTPVALVVVEEVRRDRGTDAAHIYGGLLGAMQAWAEENGVPYTAQPVGTIKKWACGKGNAGKDDVIA